jgi:hypothetical protein
LHKFDQVDSIYQAALAESIKGKSRTLFHKVEHAGYGAILSRLMTGLNISLALNARYTFSIESAYDVDSLFNLAVWHLGSGSKGSELIEWDFFRDTWNANPAVRANHQYPECPFELNYAMRRHQWCAILAQLICGNRNGSLESYINKFKAKAEWNKYGILIGIHVRRGDKNTECPYIPSEIYINEFLEIQKKYPNKLSMFLASDDLDTYKEFKKNLPNTDIVWDFDEPRFNNYNAQMVTSSLELAKQESLTAAKNICLLGECDYVIGMSTAQFTWIGGLLAVYKNNLDTSRHIMLDPFTSKRGHWACYYGFSFDEANSS